MFLKWLILLLPISVAGAAIAGVDHRDGFVRYARVDRTDDTFRELFVDEDTLSALRSDQPVSDGATIMMESYYRPGEIGSIFAKRRENGRWLYGSFSLGEPLVAFRPQPQCSGCHMAADDSDGVFTLSLLQRFADTGEPQRIECARAGRTPCNRAVYGTR